MINKEVLNYNKAQLINWLRFEAGSSNADYFKCVKTGGLKLQQVPEEYSQLLLLLKEHKPKTYLELGIGNGGSFTTACFFMQETLEHATAVDNLAYGNLIGQNEEEVLAYIKSIDTKAKKTFINSSTDDFFAENENQYDVIFIDADHSYQGVRKDFINADRLVNDGGLIIFHDIASDACPGIKKIWAEVKKIDKSRCIEFIHSNTCGIGVLKY